MQRTGRAGWLGRVSAVVSEAWRLQSYGVRVVPTNDGFDLSPQDLDQV